jgi:hypothetical protein
MTDLVDDAPVSGEAKLKSRRRRYWALVGGGTLLGLAIIALLNVIFKPWIKVAGKLNPDYAIWLAGTMSLFMLIYCVLGHRRAIVDEREERAMLWAGTICFYILLIGETTGAVLAGAGLVGPPAFMALLFGTAIIYLAIWLWLMFR